MPDTNTTESLIDVLVAECKLEVSAATFLARNMVKLASTHMVLTIREMNQGLGDDQQRHMKLIETWFELMAESLPGVSGADFNGDVRASTVFLSFESGASNSFSGKWRVPVQIPASPAIAFMRTLKQDIQHLEAAKAQRAGTDVLKHLENHPTPLAPNPAREED